MRVTSKQAQFCLLFFCIAQFVNCCSNCSSCNIFNSCTGTCNAGYFKFCLVLCGCFGCSTGCATCTGGGSTQCQSCSTGYYLSGGNSCPRCPTGCSACSTAASCSSCDSGYYVSGSSCPACDSNCLTCQTSSTYCLTCNNKYFINSNVCYDCPALCATCTSLTSCQTCTSTHTSGSVCDCISGYYQSGTNCIQCQAPCSTCQTTASYCLSCTGAHRTLTLNACPCDSGFVDISGTCQACTQPCLTCSTTQSFCNSCSDTVQMTILNGVCSCGSQKYFDNTYQCFPCTAPCYNCVFSSTHCTSCVDVNMAVDGSHNCLCNDGFYLDNLACIACTSPCTECSSSTYCTECDTPNNWILDAINHNCICKDTYYLNVNICSQCNLPCANCDTGPDYCQTCIDANQSLSGTNTCDCNIGFIPNGNYCDQCVLPCTTCTSTVNTCTGCVDPQQTLTSNQCICNPGYGISGTGCALCKSPCLTCSSSVNTCESCVDPSIFILSNNQCFCVDGQYASDSQCQICSPQCKTCITQSDFCLTCNDINHFLTLRNECICNIGYLPTAGGCLLCQPPCFACQFNIETCTECSDPLANIQNDTCICPDGKYMDQNFICQSCNPLCLTCSDTDICLNCNDYFYLDPNNMCQLCQIPCGKCNNLNSCIDCVRGFSISGNQCQNCSLGCLECVDFSNCQLCQDGYYLNEFQQCQLCQQPCELCQFSPIQCLSCQNPAQVLQNFKCQCQQNQYELNQQCVDCPFPCKSCTSDSQCLSCIQIGQIILLNQKCVCIDGYYFDGSQCLICDLNCKTCSQQRECQSCESQLFRSLKDNQCKCQDGYFDQGQLQCIQCTPENGIQIEECQFSNCSDGVWTWGEQCDDGNITNRDGCSECKIDYGYSCINVILEPSSCIKCIDDCQECDENNICKQCKDGYYLQDNQCLICNVLCKTCDSYYQCLTCNFMMINNQCRYCEDKIGYYNDNGLCISKCEDNIKAENEQCDDGNLIDGDGCDKNCKLESGFYFQNGVALQRKYPKPQLKEVYQSLFDPIRVFNLYYEDDLKYFELNFEENFQISIENFELHQDYTYNITNYSRNQTNLKNFQKFNLSITLIMKTTALDKQLVLYMSPQIFVNSQESKQQVKSVIHKISDFQFIDESTKQNTQNTINANYYMLYCILILIALSILFGGIEIFYNLLDLLQLVSYLQYVNTQFPYNLETFINIFSFAQFQFLNQYISISQFYQSYIDQEQLKPAPQKINEDGFSTNIIINFSSLITIWLTFIGSYLLAHITPVIIQKISVQFSLNSGEFVIWVKTVIIMFKQYVIRQCWIIRSQFFYSGFLRTFISTTYDFSFFLMLNIFSLSFNGYLMNQIGSYITIFFIAVFISIIILSINAVQIICQTQLEYAKYGAIYDGLKFTPICKYFHIFVLLKKFLFMASLILSYEDPLFQILQIFMLSLLQILYLINFQPLEEKYEQRKQLFCEIYMGLTEFLLFFLVVDDLQELFVYETRQMIGWFCIAFISLMLITQIILDIHQQWSILLKIYYRIKKYIIQKFTQQLPIHHDNMQQSQTMPNDIIQI